MCEFHGSNGNGFGDIWWTHNLLYFSSIDDATYIVFLSLSSHTSHRQCCNLGLSNVVMERDEGTRIASEIVGQILNIPIKVARSGGGIIRKCARRGWSKCYLHIICTTGTKNIECNEVNM